MGWTTMPKPVNVKAFMDDMYSRYMDKTCDYRILKSAIVNRTEYYCAVEKVSRETGDRVVWAGVAMLNYYPRATDGYTFGYKDMSEEMGPYLWNCPNSILELLTSTEHKGALKWREDCATVAKRKANVAALKTGDIIRLETPLRFSDGVERQYFAVLRDGRALRFISGGVRVMISRFHERNFTLVQKETV